MEITTETAARWSIPNTQHLSVAGNEDALEKEISSKFPEAKIRAKSTARYNCHGLTFAARRTCIDEASSIARILKDDGYVEIPVHSVLPGDIVLYFDYSTPATVQHSAVIVEVGEAPLYYPLVVSKWGLIGPEMLHWAHHCEYPLNLKYYRINFAEETKILHNLLIAR